MTPQDFLIRWHKAVADRDLDGLDELVAEGAHVSSPAYWSPKGPKPYVMQILKAVIDGTNDFHYTKEWVDGNEIILEFTAEIDGVNLRGIDRIVLGENGQMEHLEVMIRPINALLKLAEYVTTEVTS